MKMRILCGVWLLLMAGLAGAEEIALNPSHPDRYTVVRGDTLWGIADKFLANPWQWSAIWHDNPQIADPHWIYPGDELALSFASGRPVLQVSRRRALVRPDEVRLSPTVRSEPLDQAIPAIPLNAVQPFLTQPKVVDAGVMESAPYLLSVVGEHVTGGSGDQIYVRGIVDDHTQGYMLFRPGAPYLDADTGEVLGYEALYVGETEVKSFGDPSTLLIKASVREVVIGDRILPIEPSKLEMRYYPHAPANPIQGHIISVVDGVSQIGQWNVVILDRGTADGVEVGHVLEIRQAGTFQRDSLSAWADEKVALPPQKEGLLMVFRPYQRVSFALVLSAITSIHINDAVVNP